MSHIYAAIGSITTATRIARELSGRGVPATVTHTPAEINNGGCSYSVRIDMHNRSILEQIATSRRYKIKKLYTSDKDGVFCDLS